ncbi:MAG TPA: hypothetical protein VKB54_17545 [Solirubrobacteraceae bacterium]|nr:hypothetical protein [Solirubrobacteraceae bacterium]
MKAVRGVLRDIIDRKLWPVALLLLAGAVAVPVYLGRPSEQAAPPPPVQHADTGKASKAAVSIEDPAAEDDRRGSVRNPFKQQHLPKQDTRPSGGAANPPATTETTPPPSSGSSGSPTPQSPAGGTGTPDKPKPKPESDSDPLDTHHLTIRFGRADGQMRTYKDVARLSPLPTADNPFFVFTGVLKDGKTAVFLLSSDATATGDGHCKPSPKSCQTIEVQQGDTEFFDLAVGGQPVQYQLDVVRVFRKGANSVAAAAAANERHSVAGAAIVRSAHVNGSSAFKDAAAYRWLPDRGVLVRTPKHGAGRASANGGAAASSAGAAASLPGQPVWHWTVGA